MQSLNNIKVRINLQTAEFLFDKNNWVGKFLQFYFLFNNYKFFSNDVFI